jgi:2,3-bisphosphoglycerate-dependent phosphoglycerate mutase
VSLTIGVGEKRFEVGSDSFLKAFFSTVFARLERESWGAQYPVIMHELYTGRLSHQRAGAASKELERIRTALAQLGPEQAVWDFEDRAAHPPWGDEISPNIKSLADYFVTSDGRDFLEVLGRALQEAQRSRKDLEIR